MGMTNRVIPAQGEERGASYSLIRLDGDAFRKFQPSQQHFLLFAHSADERANRLNIGGFCPKSHAGAYVFGGNGRASVGGPKFRPAPTTADLRECRIACQPLSDAIPRPRPTFELMGLIPIASNAHIDFERHRQCRRLCHVPA